MRNEPANAPSWKGVARGLRERAGHVETRAPVAHPSLRDVVLRMAGRARGARVLDLHGGLGPLAVDLAQRGADVQVVESRHASHAPRLPRRAFDLVTCLSGAAGDDMLRVATRSLASGGRAILAVAHPYGPGREFVGGELEQLFAGLRRAGLRAVDLAEPEDWLVLLCERPRRRDRGSGR